jgi:hypothetical protein
MQCWWLVHMPLHELRTWTQPLKRTSMLKLHENFTKSSLWSNYHYHPPLSNLYMLALALGFSLSALSYQSKCVFSSSILIPCSLCLHHWHPSHLFAVPIPGLAHLCSPGSVWLPAPSSLFSLGLYSGVFSGPLSYLALLPGPCMLPGSSCFSLAPLFGLVYLASSDQRWEMLRNVGKSGWARKMREVEGWVVMDFASACLTIYYLVPHTYVNMNCNIINIF